MRPESNDHGSIVNQLDYAGSSRPAVIGYSPTVDHLFQFYGLSEGLIDPDGVSFQTRIEPMSALNSLARLAELPVTALSARAFAESAGRYAILSAGSRFSSGLGPQLVTRNPLASVELHQLKIAVSDIMSSGFAALSLFFKREFQYVIMSATELISATVRGDVDAALVENEAQLTHQDHGLYNVLDLGAWWLEKTGYPLPLDFICVDTNLSATLTLRIAHAVRASIDYGLDNRMDAIDRVRDLVTDLDAGTVAAYVDMYVSERSRDMGSVGIEALQLFLDTCHAQQIVSSRVDVSLSRFPLD